MNGVERMAVNIDDINNAVNNFGMKITARVPPIAKRLAASQSMHVEIFSVILSGFIVI